MTKDAFSQQVMLLRSTLYYVSYSLLTNRYDQEDAVQECLQKAWLKVGSLRDAKLFRPWITRILINECHNILRKRKPYVALSDEELDSIAERPVDADPDLFDALTNLEEKLRLPIVLHYYEGYTTREIASILRVPESTIKSRLVKARKNLGRMLRVQEGMA